MSDTDPIEFTDREKFILSYYRSAELSGSRNMQFFDVANCVISVACIALFIVKEELAFGFIGYLLAIGRLGYLVIEGRRWHQDFRSIVAKYDAKLKPLTPPMQQEGCDDTV